MIKKPDGHRARAIFYRMGKPIGADTGEADDSPKARCVVFLHPPCIGSLRIAPIAISSITRFSERKTEVFGSSFF